MAPVLDSCMSKQCHVQVLIHVDCASKHGVPCMVRSHATQSFALTGHMRVPATSRDDATTHVAIPQPLHARVSFAW